MDTTINIMDIAFSSELTILGYCFKSTVAQSGKKTSWVRVTGKFRAMATEAYTTDPCFTQRIQFVHSFLLAKMLHTTQNYHPQNGSCDNSRPP